MTDSQALLKWFWEEANSYSSVIVESEGFCWHIFADSRNIISASADPNRMAAFLLIGIFLDQSIYTHLHGMYSHHSGFPNQLSVYERFRSRFKFPKFENCFGQGGRMLPASTVIDHSGTNSGYAIDTAIVIELAKILMLDIYKWIRKETSLELLFAMHNYISAELKIEFCTWKEREESLACEIERILRSISNACWEKVIANETLRD